ncbi:hypothetical protein GCM10023347_33930 [Streptomyces chumphonensis]|uniref:Uncharacterized protein n=1 Tax=Streptomyces chumphonensis TaxID=1214925 RepID=A0A927ID53_9ACTN|nr:hypothetical protein [Streptomyces chumphonensis]MBD3931936.1 hypothetical protein [Streptomyces chumphonensis]
MPQPWTPDHELHAFARTESRPGPPEEDGGQWMERRQTGQALIVCECGYTSGLIDRATVRETMAELAAEHPPALGADSETPYGPRAAVAAWLLVNGVNPDDVPLEGPISVDGQHIRYAALLRNEAGRHYRDERTGRSAREERVTPLTVEPPANVQVKATR